jgi:hypothetical protein
VIILRAFAVRVIAVRVIAVRVIAVRVIAHHRHARERARVVMRTVEA